MSGRTKTAVDPGLLRWVMSQRAAGHGDLALLRSMRTAGWSDEPAIAVLGLGAAALIADEARVVPIGVRRVDSSAGTPIGKTVPTPGDAKPAGAQISTAPSGQALAATDAQVPNRPMPGPSLDDAPLFIDAGDRRVRVLQTMRHPRVVVFGDLLSLDECEGLIDLARKRLVRSLTVEVQTGGESVNADRTSDGMFLVRGENELVQRIEARIARLLQWPLENGEGLQVLRYRPGAEYKPHYDYFDPKELGTPTILKRGGQRVATLVMWIGEPVRGGATTFPDVGLELAPQRGSAVFFSYDRADAETKTLHGGAPVLEGEKWVATKWLREREFV